MISPGKKHPSTREKTGLWLGLDNAVAGEEALSGLTKEDRKVKPEKKESGRPQWSRVQRRPEKLEKSHWPSRILRRMNKADSEPASNVATSLVQPPPNAENEG